jgi:RNA polymerase sigma-70 factor, ECF subfamily
MTSSPKLVWLDDARRAAATRAADDDEANQISSERHRRPGDDPEELVRAMRGGEAWAERAFLDRYGGHVDRMLTRLLGAHPDLDDLAQEVFLRAFQRLASLRSPGALKSWLTAIAVFVAREAIRKRQRRGWLVALPIEEACDLEVPSATPEARAALRAFYEVVGALDADAGIAFTLRFVEGMELTEIADACGVSLATAKRRIKAAETEFCARGRAHEALADWFEEGTQWRLDEE